jgi:ATP-dependent Clp protease adapter protein ClpS
MKIHFEGECVVLKDKKAILEPICENLIESGLSAEIRDTEDKEEE